MHQQYQRVILMSISGILVILIGTGFFIAKPLEIFSSLSHIFSLSSIVEENTTLHQENDGLKNELFALQQHIAIASSTGEISAQVFSAYPFNTKNRIFLDKGSLDGVMTGEGVFIPSRVLIGQVTRVTPHESEVMTVFDPAFSLPVRIGAQQVDGLLKGGVSPLVTLIDKTKPIAPGDLIVNASKDFMYGVTIGTVRDITPDTLGAFLQTSIQFSYSMNDVRNVEVHP